ncbi:MAG: TIGR00153 family protein [Fervidobacterium sp.]
MPFAFARKEREVIEKIINLSFKTVEATLALKEYFNCYFSENCDRMTEFFSAIKRIEHEADEIRRYIISETYKGLFLPDMREVIHSLSESIDKIVNKCESVSKIIDYQRPNIPKDLRDKIFSQLECSVNAAKSFSNSVKELFNNIDNVTPLILEVEKLEHEEDVVEEKLLKEIFSLDIHLSEKMQLKELVINIGDIVDRTEDASDVLEVLLLKLAY